MHDVPGEGRRTASRWKWRRRAGELATRGVNRSWGRAQPREREEVLRLGADAGRTETRGAGQKQYQLPSNKAAPQPRGAAFLQHQADQYDFKKYGSSAERKRLLESGERGELDSAIAGSSTPS